MLQRPGAAHGQSVGIKAGSAQGSTLLLLVQILEFVIPKRPVAAWQGGGGILSIRKKQSSRPGLCALTGSQPGLWLYEGKDPISAPNMTQGHSRPGTVPGTPGHTGAVLNHVRTLLDPPSIERKDPCPSSWNLGPSQWVPFNQQNAAEKTLQLPKV